MLSDPDFLEKVRAVLLETEKYLVGCDRSLIHPSVLKPVMPCDEVTRVIVTFPGVESVWTVEKKVNIFRVVMEAKTGVRVIGSLDLENQGDSTVHFSWVVC